MNELKKTASKAFHVIILMITYEEGPRIEHTKAPTLHDALHEQMQRKPTKNKLPLQINASYL